MADADADTEVDIGATTQGIVLTKACNSIVLLKLSSLSSIMATVVSIIRLFFVHFQVMLLFVLVERLLY